MSATAVTAGRSRRDGARRLACLLYHTILPQGKETYFGVSVSEFAAQLDRIAALGLRGSSLEAALGSSEPRAVAMTFDDGHASHYAMAFPELRRRHMTATFFVTTDWVGTPGYVTWQQLRDMRAAGMSVQSHTVSHPALSELSHDEVRQELGESKRRLDDELGQQTTTIALPGGDFPRRWRAQDFAACGYRWIATSWWGPNHLRRDAEVLTVRRYTVRRSTSARRFDRLVLGSSPAVSLEGVRLTILSQMRSLVGAHRYTTWRQAFLRDYQP